VNQGRLKSINSTNHKTMNDTQWPEEEAELTASNYYQTLEWYPDTPKENLEELRRAVARMRAVFTRVAGGDHLKAALDFERYESALLGKLPNIHKEDII